MPQKQAPIPEIPTRGLSAFQLKAGMWYVRNKVLLRKLFLAVFILFDAGFVAFAGWRIVDLYAINPGFFPDIQGQIARPLVDYAPWQAQNRPTPLVPLEVLALPSTEGKYDLVAKFKNPNDRWNIPEFTYQFVHDGGTSPEKTAYLLPGQERYILELGVESESKLSTAQVNVWGIRWQRLSGLGIYDWEEYRADRDQIKVFNENYLSSRDLNLGEAVPVSRSRFSVGNESTYNFWNVGFVILLAQNNRVIAANRTDSGSLVSGTTKNLEVSWFQRLPTFLDVLAIPDVNILDPSAFMDFRSGAGPKK